jgi:class 3 adenylate cyclase
VVACTRCGQENPDGAKFCNACGAPLAQAPPSSEERRVVSVLFVDLVGFTSEAEKLDPEDVRAILTPYYEQVRGELERHGGMVEKFVGDAVMGVFGAPTAYGDDSERAVRAAFAVRDWAEQDGKSAPVRAWLAL